MIGFWQSENICKISSRCFQGDVKDAAIIVANDNDQTMRTVYSEFKEFDLNGYKDGRYPELDNLYSGRTSWRFDKITWFNTSIKMQAYGAEKFISQGEWDKYLILLDDCVSGYQQFIPLNQETSAITYLSPCLNLSERVASSDLKISEEIKTQIITKMNKINTLFKKAPSESTNKFKKQAIDKIERIIKTLRSRET